MRFPWVAHCTRVHQSTSDRQCQVRLLTLRAATSLHCHPWIRHLIRVQSSTRENRLRGNQRKCGSNHMQQRQMQTQSRHHVSVCVCVCVCVCACVSLSVSVRLCLLRSCLVVFVSSVCLLVCVSSEVSLTIAGTETLFQVKRVIGRNRERVVLDLLSKRVRSRGCFGEPLGQVTTLRGLFFCGAELPMRMNLTLGCGDQVLVHQKKKRKMRIFSQKSEKNFDKYAK